VNRVVADEALMDEALALARRITANAPLSVAESRRLAASALEATDVGLSRLSLEAMARLMASEDAKEGVRAFLDKRPPHWKAR
jgi:enoyl-CoA hydratase/carnithine racemase